VALGGFELSKDGKYAAYSINRAGSDWQEIYIMDVATKKKMSDSLMWVKFSGMSWNGDGFYYSRFDAPKASNKLSAMNEYQKVYFHKVGTPQTTDKLVFQDTKRPLISFGAGATEDGKYLLIYGSEGASTGNELYIQDLTKPGSKITKLFDGFATNYTVIDNIGDKLLITTDKNAPKGKCVMIDPSKPEEANWTVILPESKTDVLHGVNINGGKIFANYMKDAATFSYQYDMTGKLEREIKYPTLGNGSNPSGEKGDNILFYTFTSFTYPTTIFKYDMASGKSEIFKQPKVSFNPDDYETKQVFYPSKDGTKVPMFIVHKKGIKMDGTNPTYLYAYGGFNISLNPSFSASRIVMLENGGVFAMANLRGGGEYGEDWHKGGMLDKKQNVFNDFITGAEYLIKEKYTSSDKLAIAGGSNGGLLVGACMTQRPDLYKVCFPAVGVLDMLRFHKFTIGHAWVPEYGSADVKEQFDYLIKYSPLHNLKSGTSYPATMVTTGDHDDRVVPAHSFKFAATLQASHKGDNPVLIRIETNAGHGAGKPTAKVIDEQADIWSFMFYNMGVKIGEKSTEKS
jgi:prolyl oligopeptidase